MEKLNPRELYKKNMSASKKERLLNKINGLVLMINVHQDETAEELKRIG